MTRPLPWANGAGGGTPLSATALNDLEQSLTDAANGRKLWATLALNPDLLMSGTITRDPNGTPTNASVTWPDGAPGAYTCLAASTTFPGAVDSYQITKAGSPTVTYTQPTVTRDTNGNILTRPGMVVS